MKKNCLYCDTEIYCKRLTKKYCNDKCKQLAYFKRNGLQPSNKTKVKLSAIISVTETVKDSKTIQEEIINEIANKVVQLIDLRESEKSKSNTLCLLEPFSIKSFTNPID